MITKNIPRDLRERVREFYHLRYAKGRIFDEGQILDSLNAELRTEIASYNTRAVVSVVPLLANSPLRFTRAMTVDMSPTIYFARDLVVQKWCASQILALVETAKELGLAPVEEFLGWGAPKAVELLSYKAQSEECEEGGVATCPSPTPRPVPPEAAFAFEP